MKKKSLLLSALLCLCLCACNQSDSASSGTDTGQEPVREEIREETEPATVSADDVDDIVTGSGMIIYEDEEIALCDYQDLVVTVDTYKEYEPTQEELDNYYDYMISSAEEALGVAYEESDVWISEHFSGYSTIDELKADLKEEYISEKQGSVAATSANDLIEYLYRHSRFSPSEDREKIMKERLKHYYTEMAVESGWEDLDQMLVWDYGYENWDDFVQSDYFSQRLETNTNMDLLFDTLAVQTGLAQQYGIDPEEITETILQDPEHADYDDVMQQKQAMQKLVTDYIYDNSTMKDTNGEEVEKLEYFEY